MTKRHRLSEDQIERMAHKIHERVMPEEPWEMCPGMHEDHHRLANLLGDIVAPDTITRYFEAHVTMEPDPEHTFEEFAEALTVGGSEWRASRFEADDVDHIAGKWFASYRSTSYAEIVNEVRAVVESFLAAGTAVLRWKIEETLLDSKLGDEL